ncbi:hypothetical protein BC835DRAFT_1422370 [Cytidiella melzeri]|nr:hypothetical protein BC835DRAFT_1422370 [Cytidiella melzeri]
MHLSTSLILFAAVVTGTFHIVTVSAIPYDSTGSRFLTPSGNPTSLEGGSIGTGDSTNPHQMTHFTKRMAPQPKLLHQQTKTCLPGAIRGHKQLRRSGIISGLSRLIPWRSVERDELALEVSTLEKVSKKMATDEAYRKNGPGVDAPDMEKAVWRIWNNHPKKGELVELAKQGITVIFCKAKE